MRSSALKYFGLTGILALAACGSSDEPSSNPFVTNSGGTSNVAGGGTSTAGGAANPGAGTSAGGAAAGTTSGGAGGVVANAGTAGVAGGAGGAAGGAGGAAGGAGGAAGGAGGAAGGAAGGDIIAVKPSAACGVAIAPDDGVFNIDVMGTSTRIGAWTDNREYTISKPSTYTNATPFILVFMGPGCGGGSGPPYAYDNNANNTIIRIGVKPSTNGEIQGAHGTNQNQGCFDDKAGDDSVDFVLYEDLYDLLDTQLCFDKNRVFFGGNSSGSWWSNEHGCKYAGDPVRPVRGIMPNTGGLPDQPEFKPTCTTNGMAGMWIHGTGDTTNPFSGNIYAINRAMTVNGCVAGQTWDNAEKEPYPIGGGQADNTCKRILGCNPLFPLVVCDLNLNDHGSHDDVVNPGVSTFLQSFLAPPLK